MSAITAGPRCGECRETEQRCAYLAGCCPDCTHWPEETDDQRPAEVPDDGRHTVQHGTDAGYWQHVRDHTAPCWPCRYAHLQAKGLVA